MWLAIVKIVKNYLYPNRPEFNLVSVQYYDADTAIVSRFFFSYISIYAGIDQIPIVPVRVPVAKYSD
jgi:hypothetical protein